MLSVGWFTAGCLVGWLASRLTDAIADRFLAWWWQL
jgi:hypothetical protein